MTRRSFMAAALTPLAPESQIEWIALDVPGGPRSVKWQNRAQSVSFGSLLKPFLVVAYGMTHSSFPIVNCLGVQTGCWNPRGHGRQDVIAALANSCNTYFLQVTARLSRPALDRMCLSYGLSPPDRSDEPNRLIGLGDGWRQTPMQAAEAFANLVTNAADPNVRIALRGMEQCARKGTAKAIGMPCYAKTGTARCSHNRRGLGDGFVAAMYGLDQPRHVLLVGQHNTTGANAAKNVMPLSDRLA